MADDREDEAENIATRNKILALQSENSRKNEWLVRLREKKTALDDELKARTEDRNMKEEEIIKEKRKTHENSENRHTDSNLEEEAVRGFIEREVRVLLAARIPAFKMDELKEEDSDDEEANDDKEVQDDGSKRVHESVIVTYLAPNPQEREKPDEYRVTYRVDKEITGLLLHEDACEFWGCSKDEFKLCKLGDKLELVEFTQVELAKNVSDESILNPMKRANLFLCHGTILQERKDLLKSTPLDIEEVIKRQSKSEVEDSALTTMKHGGKAQEQQQEDHFAVAFLRWPGIYNLLKYSSKDAPIKNWHRIKCRDILVYTLLALFSGLTILQRFPVEYYWLRQGVVETVGYGMPGETSSPADGVVNIKDIRQYDDIWKWVRGSYHYQVFNNNSTLRSFYMPVGVLRVRQQKAGVRRECRREEVPIESRGTCHHITVYDSTQDKRKLIIPKHFWIDTDISSVDSGRLDAPDPILWSSSQNSDAELTGYLQGYYDGSGYMVDYNLTNPEAARIFLQDMEVFRTHWLTPHTRLLVFEVLLANYNLGGFISSSFLFELSASGSVMSTMHLFPLNLGDNVGGGNAALALDFLRGILVFYILTVQVVCETRFKNSLGRSGLEYIVSFTGFIDMSTVATYVAMTVMRLEHDPPDPQLMTQFYSYTFDAIVHERLFTTEGLFLLLVMVRFTSFMKLSPHIDQYWKMIQYAAVMISYWMFIFVPAFLGAVVFANCIWSPHIRPFSTWWETVVSLVFLIKQDFDLEKMWKANKTWTIPLLCYYYVLMTLFVMNGFLAIVCYAYFQVQLLDTTPKESKPWNNDQWMDWILPGFVYKCFTGRAPGASKREDTGDDDGGEDGDEDSDDDGDDAKDD